MSRTRRTQNKVFGTCTEDKMAPLPRRHYQEKQDESLEMFCSRTGLRHHTTERNRTLSAAEDQKPEPGKQLAQKLDRTIHVTMNYLFYLPKDYAEKDSWPLLLFLHGAGERGDDLEKVKVHGPPKLIAAGKEFPFLVVSPQCPNNHSWRPDELSALLDEIVEKYKVDKDQIFVTGLSMGGFGTWSLAAYSPERFAALIPICGGGDPNTARRLAHVAVWVFHGAKDPAVPLELSEKMVEALKKATAT